MANNFRVHERKIDYFLRGFNSNISMTHTRSRRWH